MKNKFILETIISILFVFVGTYFVYGYLKSIPSFWDAQNIWSIVLALGWIMVSIGYYHQGWLIHLGHDTKNISILLPATVFFVQCVLFIKGIYYNDWSLFWGALIVNSGVSFYLYQIAKNRNFLRK